MSFSKNIDIIKEYSRELVPNSKLMLFGSRAKQSYDTKSDYDFLIISENNIDLNNKKRILSTLRKRLATQNIPVDILLYSDEEVSEKKEIIGHIIKKIFDEGLYI